jgi:hypothetical protein
MDVVYIFLIEVLRRTVVRLRNWNICLPLTGAYDICPLVEQLGLEGLVLVTVVVKIQTSLGRMSTCNVSQNTIAVARTKCYN